VTVRNQLQSLGEARAVELQTPSLPDCVALRFGGRFPTRNRLGVVDLAEPRSVDFYDAGLFALVEPPEA
jgi:hypothetical protein